MLNLSAHQINVFLAAAETLNFTQAAQRLQVTQPSVSQHIQALEEHFGLPLFQRAGRSVELTEAGQALVPLAREMIFLMDHIEETMSSLKGSLHGHLTLSCSTAAGRYILPRLLADFHRSYPQVHATCHVVPHEEALKMLGAGQVHLALTSRPEELPEVDYHRFSCESLLLTVPLNHRWASQAEISPAELTSEDFILPEEDSETYQALREGLVEAGLSIYHLHALISLGSLEAIALSIQEGLGVGFLPETILNRLVKNQVCTVKVKGLDLVQDIYLGRNLRRPLTHAVNAFWEFTGDCSHFAAYP